MTLRINVQTVGFERQFRAYVAGTGRDAQEAALYASKIYIRQLIGMTPPGDGKKGGESALLTKEDQRRGEAAIIKDLRNLFIGVKRGIGPRGQDPAPIHEELFKRWKRSGRVLNRAQANHYFVDQIQVRALQRELFSHVGRLAANWARGAAVVAASGIPAWVKRHGPRGGGHLVNTPERFTFQATNPSIPDWIMSDMSRRQIYAERNTGNTLERNLAAIMAKRAARFNQKAA